MRSATAGKPVTTTEPLSRGMSGGHGVISGATQGGTSSHQNWIGLSGGTSASKIEPRSVSSVLSRYPGPLSPEVAQPILRDIADALAYAHGQRVVHRDLKPANVLCSANHAWLMDFGIAKALLRLGEDRDLTRAGASPGTPRYMAPEQLREGGRTAPPSDVFAFGQLAPVGGLRPRW